MTKNELIKEVKRRYPVGSRFKDLVHGEVFTVKSHIFNSFGDNQQIYIPVEPNPFQNKTARVYHHGKWAEIVGSEKNNSRRVTTLFVLIRKMELQIT